MHIKNKEEWDPRNWHCIGDGELEGDIVWRQTDEGIEQRGHWDPSLRARQDGVMRTKGEPITLTRIVGTYDDLIGEAHELTGVPRQLMAAVIAAESRGKSDAERAEPHLGDVSIGLAQTLTATASRLARLAPEKLNLDLVAQTTPLPRGGSLEQWRQLLGKPEHAIRLGAQYLRVANDNGVLRYDPVLCYAAYNAGSVRANLKNPWGMHYYRKKLGNGRWADAMDNFCRWYGDACAVYGVC